MSHLIERYSLPIFYYIMGLEREVTKTNTCGDLWLDNTFCNGEEYITEIDYCKYTAIE